MSDTGNKKVYGVNYVIDMFKILADNEYSLLWDLVDDFTINGHTVSVKSSKQFRQVIIDGRYQYIGGPVTIVDTDRKEYTPLEHVRKIISEPIEKIEQKDCA